MINLEINGPNPFMWIDGPYASVTGETLSKDQELLECPLFSERGFHDNPIEYINNDSNFTNPQIQLVALVNVHISITRNKLQSFPDAHRLVDVTAPMVELARLARADWRNIGDMKFTPATSERQLSFTYDPLNKGSLENADEASGSLIAGVITAALLIKSDEANGDVMSVFGTLINRYVHNWQDFHLWLHAISIAIFVLEKSKSIQVEGRKGTY